MKVLVEILTLGTSRGRLLFFAAASLLVFLAPVRILAQLSIWKHIGIPAPSIGLTRAYHYLLHGDPARAYHQNALIFVVLCLGLPIIAKDAYNVAKLAIIP